MPSDRDRAGTDHLGDTAPDGRSMGAAPPPDDRRDRPAPSDSEEFRLTRTDGPAGSPPRSMPAIGPGQVLGDFFIEREIGRGGMGVVYEAKQTSLRRRVALKVLALHAGFHDDRVARFHREAEAAGRQAHPGIVAIHAVGEQDGVHFIAQELIEGGRTLADLIDEARALKSHPKDRLRILAELLAKVADALGHAHANGVIHRDVKPSNILIAPDGSPKIGDFGLAKVDSLLALTRTGELEGTPFYVSPEQAEGSPRSLDHRTDVYSLGVAMYEALTLVRPFRGDSTLEIIRKVVSHEPEDPQKVNPRVPHDLAVICLKAMEKAPSSRYATMGDLAADLRRWLAGEAILARPAGPMTRGIKFARRHRVLTVGVLGAILSALVIAGVIAVRLDRQSRHCDRLIARAEEAAEAEDWDTAIEQIIQAAGLRPRDRLIRDRHRLYLQQKEVAAIKIERDEKDRALRRSEALRLSAEAERLLEVNPALALLLAREAARRLPDPGMTGLVAGAVGRCREIRTLYYRRFPFLPELFEMDRGHFMNVAVGPDGRKVFTTSYDDLPAIWDVETGERLRLEEVRIGGPFGVATSQHGVYSPDGRHVGVVMREAPVALLFDARSGRLEHRLVGHSEPSGHPGFIAFSPDSRWAATAARDSTARIWSVETGRAVHVLRGHTDALTRLAFSPDGRLLATVSMDRTARVWDVETGSQLHVFRGHQEHARAVRFSPDGRLLASADNFGLRVWEVDSERLICHLRDQWNPNISIWEMEFSPDGSRITATWGGPIVHVWDVSTGRSVLELRGHEETARCSHFSPDGNRILTAAFDGTVRLWDARTGNPLAILRGHEDYIHQAWFTPDGRRVVTIAEDMTARVWDTETGAPREPCVIGGMLQLVFDEPGMTAPDGRRLVVTQDSLKHTAFIRKPGQADAASLALAHETRIQGGRFSPDGRWLVTGSEDTQENGVAWIWDARTGALVRKLHSPFEGPGKLGAGCIRGACFSAEPGGLITATGNGIVRVWSLDDGAARTVLRGHTRPVSTFSLDRERQRILTASWDGTARIWDASSGREIATLRGHEAEVTSGVFCPEGRLAVTTSLDGTLRLWDAKTGSELMILRDAEWAKTRRVGFSPDGARIVAVGSDGTTRGWPVDPMAAAERAKPRDLTIAEKRRFAVWEPGEEEALALVEGLFSQHILARDVIAQVESDVTLREEVAAAAIRLARQHEDDWGMLRRIALHLQWNASVTPEASERAARYAAAAERLRADGSPDR